VERLLAPVEVAEDLGERQREQETGQQLQSGLGDPQLLQELVPVPVEALVLRLVAVVVRRRRCHGAPPRYVSARRASAGRRSAEPGRAGTRGRCPTGSPGSAT